MRLFQNWNKPKVYRRRILFEQLEERIVLDAAVTPQPTNTILDNPEPTNTQQSEQQENQVNLAAGVTVCPLPPPPTPAGEVFHQDLNVVLISNALDKIPDISQGAMDAAKVITYDALHDNLITIIGELQEVSKTAGQKIDNLAIIGHGAENAMRLGTDRIDFSNVGQFSSELSSLGQALSDQAQIQLFTCSLAKDASGKAFVDSIAKLTGADVYASDDNTGGDKGDWTLEYGSDSTVALKSLMDTQYLTNIHTDLPYAPELTISGTAHGAEDTPVDLSHLVSIKDQDVNETVTVTLTANQGFSTLDAVAQTGATVTDPNTSIITIEGSQSAVNETLNHLTGALVHDWNSSDGSQATVLVHVSDSRGNDDGSSSGTLYASIDTGTLEEGQGVHVLVVSSAIQSSDQLVHAAADGVLTVTYDPTTDSPDNILLKIETALAGYKADSIAFATHDQGPGQFYLTGDYSVNSSTLLGYPELQHFWKEVGSLVNDNGRIDLLACGLGSNETGKLLLSQLESMVGRNFAASNDATGNAQYGGDWVLESDNVDVGPVYFNQDGLNQYSGVLKSETKIVALDGANDDIFGHSVAISGDYAIVGAKNDDTSGGANAGSAYIYKMGLDGAWTQTAHILASDGAYGDWFGYSVSISGNYAIVGAYGDDTTSGTDAGSAYIYKMGLDDAWTQTAHIFASDGAGSDYFGSSVSISEGYAIVGAYKNDNGGHYDEGSAYIYKLGTNGLWTETQQITAEYGGGEDHFGYSVSISSNYAIVGAYGHGLDPGSAYIFKLGTNGLWTELQELWASDRASEDYFGYSVSISGNYAIVGAYGDDATSGDCAGSAYIYKLGTNGLWTQQQEITLADRIAGDMFGYSVAISGNYAIVGAYSDSTTDEGGHTPGDGASAHIYELGSNGLWTRITHLFASDGASGDWFGYSVSISGDNAIVGALNDDTTGGTNTGSAYIFHYNHPPTANDSVVTAIESRYVFSATDFNFADIDGDALQKVKITQLESAWALRLDGVDVTLNQDISISDINAGKLTLVPMLHETRQDYATFGFQVFDGTIYSASANIMTIDLSAVKYAPVLSLSHGAGSLDTTFGGDGKLTTDISGSNDSAHSVAIQVDGKIVVAGGTGGDFVLARYNSNGSLDTSFSGDGKLTTDISGSNDSAYSVAIQADGKIVVAGYANSDFGVARYNSNGSLDTSFSGDGKLTTDISGNSLYDSAQSVAIQSDGKIVVTGYTNDSFALARYNSDGTLDTSFSYDGKLTTDIGRAFSSAIQTDGKIIATGYVYDGTDFDFVLARYNINGTLDTSFSGDGKLTTDISGSNDSAYSVAIQADGKIVVAGSANSDFGVARYNSNGTLDTSFGGDGILTTDFSGSGSSESACSLAIQSDGKIVVAGCAFTDSNWDFALVRYNSNGSLDTSFSGDGKLTTDISGNSLYDSAQSVAIQSDGKIVVAGGTHIGSDYDFALARFDVQHIAYIENTESQVIDSSITLTDIDNDNMVSAKIQISGSSGNYLPEDTLSIDPTYLLGDVHGNFEAGILTLSGSTTKANYQSMLAHVAYTNSSDSPNTSPRTVTWTVTDDGMVNSVPQTSTITVTAVNDAPAATGPETTTSLNEDGSASITVYGTDVDNPALSDVSFTITSDVHNGTLVAGDKVLDSAGHYSKVYTYTPDANFNGSDPFEFTFTTKSETSPDNNTTSVVSVPITVTAVNDLPTASGPVATTTLNEDGSASITVYGTDVDNPALTDVSFTITTDVSHGMLVAANTVLDSPGHYSKVYTYTPDANFNGSDSFKFMFNALSDAGTLDSFNGTGTVIGSESDCTTSIALGDVNGDDHLDVIAGNYGQATKVYLGNGSGEFSSGTAIIGTESDQTRSIALGDVNEDGKLDIVAGRDGTSKVFLGDGLGGFTAGTSIGVETQNTFSIALGDVNKDGHLDVITSHYYETSKVHFGDGSGGFADAMSIATSADYTVSIALGDVNGDENLDVLTGNSGSNSKVYLGDGFGGFSSGTAIGTETDWTFSIAVGDVNADGKLDVIAGKDGTNKVYLGDGTGEFSSGTAIGTESDQTRSLALADVNGDGKLDAIAGNYGQTTKVYLGNGNGGFSSPTVIGTNSDTTCAVALGDVNGDRKLDIITGNQTVTNKVYENIYPFDSSEVNVSIMVNPVNDAPTSTNGSVTATEDTQYVFSSGDFAFTDVDTGNTLQKIQITQLDNAGTFKLNGVDVTLNQEISVADINAKKLTFDPTANANGTGYANFQFKVSDGSAYSTSSYTETINVTAVNDLPVGSGPDVSTTLNEDGTASITVNGTDLDNPSLSDVSFAITSNVHNGTLVAGTTSLDSAGHYSKVYTYTPNSNFNGSDSFAFTFTTKGETSSATDTTSAVSVPITVTAVNDLPLTQTFSVNGLEDAAVLVQGWKMNDAEDGNNVTPSTLVITSLPDHGTLLLSGTGGFIDAGTVGIYSDDTRCLAVGDVNGDGTLDVVAGNWGQTSKVYINDGHGVFSYAGSLSSAAYSTISIALADINGDGNPDVVTGNYYEPMMVFLNNGHGVFTYSGSIGAGTYVTNSIKMGDINGDGYLDLVAVKFGLGTQVYTNDSHGTFTYSGMMGSASNWTHAITLGDINGDGYLDVIEGNWNHTNKVYLNDKTGSFDFSTDITADTDATGSIQVGDVNNDGHLDVVAGNWGGGYKLYLNNGDGTFRLGQAGEGMYTNAVRLGDVNKDGYLDIVAANWNQVGKLYINQGAADGSWQGMGSGSSIGDGTDLVQSMQLADVNGDGYLDATVGNNDQLIRVYENRVNDTPITLNQVIGSSDLGHVKFVPDTNWNGTTILAYNAIDFEGGTSSGAAAVSINIAAVNDDPTALTLSSNSVNENQASGTTVGTFTTTDPDSGDTFTYSLVSGVGSSDNGSFTIEGNTLKTNAIFDHETKDTYSIRVKTTDLVGASYEKQFTVNVGDVNDAPTSVNGAVTATEDTQYTFKIEDFSFADVEGSSLQKVKITALETAGSLKYDGNDVVAPLEIAIADIAKLKFDPALNANGDNYSSFEFMVSDGTDYSVSDYTMTINVTAVNDAPVLSLSHGAGSLDPTFDSDGKVITDFGMSGAGANALAIQSDGKIVVAGAAGGVSTGLDYDIALARYCIDGSLDKSFSGDGKLTTHVGSSNDYGNAMAIQTDGKIVVAGHTLSGAKGDIALVRYNVDGTLDESFDGDGILTTDFSGSGSYDSVRSVAIQADGKIVVALRAENGLDYDFALVRYNSDGSLDTNFDGDGKLTTDFGGSNAGANSAVVQTDGKIVVAGYADNGSNADIAVARYNSNGTLDTSFSNDGKLTTDFGGSNDYARSLVVRADGRIVVAGYTKYGPSQDIALVRYNIDGTLDTSFSGDGKLTTDFPISSDFGESYVYANSVAIQADGKIVVAGYTENAGNDQIAVARYNIDGTLDASFGGDGKLTTDVSNSHDYAGSLSIQADGRIVVAGYSYNVSYSDVALVRYDASHMSYSENAGAQVIDNAITLTDVDNDNIASAKIQITGNYQSGQDMLGIAAEYLLGGVKANSEAGILTLTGSTTKANYESMLEHVTYTNSSDSPNTSPRTLTWAVNDGAVDSVGQTSTITVSAVNDLPEASGPVTTSLNEDGTASITVHGTDLDNSALSDVSFAVTSDVSNGILVEGDTSLVNPGHYSKVYTYTPDANFNGSDPFEFTFSTKSETSSATDTTSAVSVPITVNNVNDSPLVSGPSSNIQIPNGQIERIVLTYDDGDLYQNQIVTMILDTAPSNGTLHLTQSDAEAGVNELHTGSVITAISNGGNQTLFFKANTNGSDTFTFHARDNGGGLNDTSALATIRLTVNSAGGNNPVQPWVPPNNPPTINPPGSHENTPHNIPIFGAPNSLMPSDINPVHAPLSTIFNPDAMNLFGPSSVQTGSTGTGNSSFDVLGMGQQIMQSSQGPAGNSPSQVAAAMMADGLNVQEQQQLAQKFVEQQQITEQGHSGDQPVIGQQGVVATPQSGQTDGQNNLGSTGNIISGVLQKPGSEQVASLVGKIVNGGFTYGPNALFFSNNQSSGNEVHQGVNNQLNPQITVNMSKGSFTNYLNWIAKATISLQNPGNN